MKGVFIAFEGPDGSGKSTMIKMVAKHLQDMKIDFIETREPGGTKIGENIRRILLDNRNKGMFPETEALLYAASRGQHLMEKILPAIEEGKIVLCDRFLLSSLAYQGVGRDLGIEKVMMINDFAIKGTRPHLTLFFHVDPTTTLLRKTNKRGGDRLEREGESFHKKVYEGYMKLIQTYSDNIRIVDATKSREEVFEETKNYIDNFLKGRGII